MESFDVVEWPPMRLLLFLAISGVFFYRSFPKPEWKWYLGLPLYWVYILFFYFSYAGMMSVGLGDVLKDRLIDKGNIDAPITITSLILLLFYRFFSRYSKTDESTEWAVEFIKGILTTYLAIVGLFFAFSNYVDTPRLESFSHSWAAYTTLAVCVGLDFILWWRNRHTVAREEPARSG